MYAGESGVVITLPTNNVGINVSTYTCTMVVGRPDGQVATYTATPLGDGSGATFTTTGAEFPISGTYNVEFHARSGSNYFKSRVQLPVLDAYA